MFAREFLQKSARQFSTTSSRLNVARMTLVGRVGATPTQAVSKAGNEYLKYPIAVNTGKDQTSWFNILAFDPNLVQFITKHVDKGSMVYVEADASISKYVNEEGANRNSLTLIQQSISPLTWPKREANQNTEESIAEETHESSA